MSKTAYLVISVSEIKELARLASESARLHGSGKNHCVVLDLNVSSTHASQGRDQLSGMTEALVDLEARNETTKKVNGICAGIAARKPLATKI